MIIAIDGPAGAGKSTVAKLIAKKLKFLYIDTGAMYRALTLKVLDAGVDTGNTRLIINMAHNSSIDLVHKSDGHLKVMMDGCDVSTLIRHPRITKSVSDIAKIKGVRKVMLELQRKLGKKRNSVLEGRDIGTVVFPDAEKKFYLDANFAERVNRRYKELKNAKLKEVTAKTVASDLSNRDSIDSTRKFAPLKKAKDAIYVDSTRMSISQVTNKILAEIRNPSFRKNKRHG